MSDEEEYEALRLALLRSYAEGLLVEFSVAFGRALRSGDEWDEAIRHALREWDIG